MSAKKTIKWLKRKATESGTLWEDIFSANGHWWIAQGYDERDRKAGKPFLLMHSRAGEKPPWLRVDTFRTIAEATNFAEEMQ